jgi:predicted dehydrogenase
MSAGFTMTVRVAEPPRLLRTVTRLGSAHRFVGGAVTGVLVVDAVRGLGPPAGDARIGWLFSAGAAGAIDALLRAITEGAEVPVPGEEGRKSLELVLAAYRSIESGRAVTLPLEPPL